MPSGHGQRGHFLIAQRKENWTDFFCSVVCNQIAVISEAKIFRTAKACRESQNVQDFSPESTVISVGNFDIFAVSAEKSLARPQYFLLVRDIGPSLPRQFFYHGNLTERIRKNGNPK